MRLLLISGLLLLGFPVFTKAQNVGLLTLNQMEQRFANGKDTVYAVNFWATWCGPCVAELPHFEKLQKAYKDRPFKVLLVSLDFKSKLESGVRPFVKKAGLQNEVFLLNESNQQEFIDRVSKDWSGAIPATLFINNDKKTRKFYEQEFTYDELEKTYQSFK